ncbi:MAG TPA: chemotaxis protein CheB, partial [Roseiflexaceae bacterium]|nr:chemotaxis protein CheB [Roseiflexaceae bacterium]
MRATMLHRDMIVVGASAGGVETLKRLVAQLPADLPASIFVVLHMAANDPGYLPAILSSAGPFVAKLAEQGQPIRHGQITIAPPDKHLLLKNDQLLLARGPRENRSRPAIDPLFRSAAAAYSTRVIGVLLSGLLDDGLSGMAAIRRCGGITIVQDPDDATYPELPRNAIEAGVVDYRLPVAEMGALISQLVQVPVAAPGVVPEDIALEAAMAERAMSDVPSEERLGDMAPLSCPECGGPLWRIDDATVRRYRCHVGHGYTARTLLSEQGIEVERALWIALRTMEERARLLSSLGQDEQNRGDMTSAEVYRDRSHE